MLKAGLALMLSHGQRPRVQVGHHVAVIEFAERNLAPDYAPLCVLFDRMRRKRNSAFYDVTTVSIVEAEEAVKTSEQFLNAVEADIAARLPSPENPS